MAKKKPGADSAKAELAAWQEWNRRHSKRPDPLVAPRTRDNICKANGHTRGRGC